MLIQNFKILESLSQKFEDGLLKDVHVICVQHVVASTISLFYALFEKGLSPKNLSVIGKCYSTRPEAMQYLMDMGVDIAPESLYFNPDNSFDTEFKNLLIKFFEKRISDLENSGCEKLILLDDGGELLSLANSLAIKNSFWREKFVGIEQTTAGYEKIKPLNPIFPVINVARSDIKLLHESPFIGRIATERLLVHLNNLCISPNRALVIGNGAVGSHIYSELTKTIETQTFDLNKSKSSIQTQLDESTLSEFDLIIGCTGRTVLFPDHFSMLQPNTCLVSVSSSDREFSAETLRKKTKNITSCHQDIFADNIHILNCGFPINFDDSYEEIDTEEFQLTRAILFAAILQSVSLKHNSGLINLNQQLQSEIYNAYKIQFLLP